MALSRQGRSALLAAAAFALMGALVFLFIRTAGVDVRREADSAALLRELRALDARLDGDAGRLANDYSAAQPAAVDRGPVIARVLRELDQGGPAAAELATQLRTGINEKISAIAALRAEHARSGAALKAADEALVAVAAEANTARLRRPGLTDAAYAIGGQVEALRYGLRELGVETVADDVRAIEPRLATLRAASDADSAVGSSAARAELAARAFLASVTRETEAWKRVSFHPVGAQIERSADQLAKALAAKLEDQQRWRTYLFFYAAALLVAAGYLGARFVSTQAQLRTANENLEKRVEERTRDLSAAMTRLKESEAQLVQSEKMSSLGQMVAGVAHEINTPLAYVKNSLWTVRSRMPDLREAHASAERLMTLLRSPTPDPADLEEAFAAVNASLKRLDELQVLPDLDTLTRDGVHGIEQISELVTNLRNFSRVDRSRVASFNVNEGVHATLLIARAQLRNVDLVKRLGDIPSITCSPSQVNQVLLNLLTNAAQAHDKPNGRITVSTRAVDAGAIAMDVEDSGSGIAPDVLPKIFDPFFTTKEVGKGTGLGLSITYKIVEQHGGHIDVRSEPGVGSTFTVTLPVDPPRGLAGQSANDEAAA